MLTVAAREPDEEHAYGHTKAEYFSSGVEGSLILVAAISIGTAAVGRLLAPRPLEQLGVGLAVSVTASLVNLVVARVLLRAGRRFDSVTLGASAHHLLTDVWTSAGVLAGVGLVALTGWQPLDPVVALIVAANIIWTGGRILRQSVLGLLDTALPIAERDAVRSAVERHLPGACSVSRPAHAAIRRAPVRVPARAGAGRMDRSPRARTARAARARDQARRAECHRFHAPRGDRGPLVVG